MCVRCENLKGKEMKGRQSMQRGQVLIEVEMKWNVGFLLIIYIYIIDQT